MTTLFALVLLVSVSMGGCGAKVPDPRNRLPEVALPDLSQLDPSAQESIRQSLLRVESFKRKSDEQNFRRLGSEYGDLGMRLLAFQLFDPATIALENACELAADDFTWRYYLAHALRQSGKAPAAIAEFQAVLKMLAGTSGERRWGEPTHCWIGELYLQTNNPERAKQHFEKALEVQPRSAFASFGLARVAQREGDDEAAIEELQRTLQRAPDAKNAHYALMMCLRRTGDRVGAQRHMREFQRAPRRLTIRDMLLDKIERMDNSSRAHRQRGYQALFVQGDPLAAIRHYQTALKGNESDPVLHHNLATAFARSGQANAAVHHFQEAVRLKPDLAAAHSNLGVMFRAHGDLKKSIEHLEQAREHDPQDAVNSFELGHSLMRAEDLNRAVEMFDEVIKMEPAHERAFLHRATCFKMKREYVRSREALMAGLKVLPDHGPLQHQLVELLAACPVEKIRDGKLALETARKIDRARFARIRAESMAVAFAEVGNFAEARVELNEAIKVASQRGNTDRAKFLKKLAADFIEQEKPVRFPEFELQKKAP